MPPVNNKKLDAKCIGKLCEFINAASFLYLRNKNIALMGNILIEDNQKVFSLHNDGKSLVLLYSIPEKYTVAVSTALKNRTCTMGKHIKIGSRAWIEVCDSYSKRLDAHRYLVRSALPKNPALTLMKLLERQK